LLLRKNFSSSLSRVLDEMRVSINWFWVSGCVLGFPGISPDEGRGECEWMWGGKSEREVLVACFLLLVAGFGFLHFYLCGGHPEFIMTKEGWWGELGFRFVLKVKVNGFINKEFFNLGFGDFRT